MLSNFPRKDAALYFLLPILALSLFLNSYGTDWGLPAIWHPDERRTIEFIVIPMARNLDPNPHDFLKPHFYYYFLEIVLSPYYFYNAIFDTETKSITDLLGDVTLISRIITATIGTATVLLIYLLGSRHFNHTIGLLSAIFLAISMGFATHAHFAYMDIPMIFLTLLSVLLCLQYLETRQLSRLYLASFVGGISVSTKYNAALPVLVALFISNWDQIAASYHTQDTIRAKIRSLLPRSWTISLILVLAGFLLGTPFSVLDFPHFASHVIKQVFITGGYKGFVGAYGWLPNLSNLQHALGIPLFYLSLAGLVGGLPALLKKPNKKATILFVIPILYYASIGSWRICTLRYVLIMLPFLVFWAAVLVHNSWEHAKRAKILVFTLVVGVLSYSACYTFHGVMCFSNDTREISGEWIREHVPAGSKVEVYSYSSYLPRFPRTLHVQQITPNFMVESSDYEQFKARFKRSCLGGLILKLLGRDLQTDGVTSRGDNRGEFSVSSLKRRNPDFIILTSFFYKRFLGKGKDGAAVPYPTAGKYFQHLITEEAGYKVVAKFEDETPTGEFVNPSIHILKNMTAVLFPGASGREGSSENRL
jgi:4-amino-4-deoxy-L-arabinose transferase-like glycosyltransferase